MFEECKLEGEFTLTSGKKSTVFYDFDLLTPQELVGYVDKLCVKLQQVKFDFVVAPAIGGIIVGWMVAGEFGKRLVIADKEGKLRGIEKVEGTQYIVVDDVISTYGTIKKVANRLNPPYQCVGVGALVFRGDTKLNNTFFLAHKEIEK